MKSHNVTFPELALIAGTRAMAGAGIALLFGDCLSAQKKRSVGWTLLAIGSLTTIPLLAEVLHNSNGKCGAKSEAEPQS